MTVDQIRLSIFLGVLGAMLVLESLIPRHATVDSKPRRLAINFSLTGINVLLVRGLLGEIGRASCRERV